MSLYNQRNETMDHRDINTYTNLLRDDFTVVLHKSGNSFAKTEWCSMVEEMMANNKCVQES